MKAVLVGTVGEDRLYYILDSAAGENDGAIERPDSSVVMFDFMSFVSSGRNIKKIRTSRFHRKLWDAPKDISSGSWYQTFIEKTKEVNDKLLEGSPVYSSLGKSRKKTNKLNEKSEKFQSGGLPNQILNKSLNESVLKLSTPEYMFKSAKQRRDMWEAMCLLKEIEENENNA